MREIDIDILFHTKKKGKSLALLRTEKYHAYVIGSNEMSDPTSILTALINQFYPEPRLVNQDFLLLEITALLSEHGAKYDVAVAARKAGDQSEDDLMDDLRKKERDAREPLVYGLLEICGLSHLASIIDMRSGDYEAVWELMTGVLD